MRNSICMLGMVYGYKEIESRLPENFQTGRHFAAGGDEGSLAVLPTRAEAKTTKSMAPKRGRARLSSALSPHFFLRSAPSSPLSLSLLRGSCCCAAVGLAAWAPPLPPRRAQVPWAASPDLSCPTRLR